MADPAYRARVQRFLGGDIRVDDLTRLFLYARAHSDGRACVREIGDFVAHQEERNKGIVTRDVRDWFLTTWFHTSHIGGPQPDARRLPANFTEVLSASFRRTPPNILRDQANLGHGDPNKLLRALAGKFVRNDDDTLSVSPNHTSAEMRLLNALMNITARPAFDDEQLHSELSDTLRSLGLLTKGEKVRFAELKPAITLYALSVMHNCVIRFEADRTATLKLAVAGDVLTIQAPVPANFPGVQGPVLISSSIFNTALPPRDHCRPELLNGDRPSATVELETPSLLLSPLL